MISRTAATGFADTGPKPCLLPGQRPRPFGRNGTTAKPQAVCVHTCHNSPLAQRGQILSCLSCTSPAPLQPAPKQPLSWRLHSHIEVLLFFSKLLFDNPFSLNCCCGFSFGLSSPRGHRATGGPTPGQEEPAALSSHQASSADGHSPNCPSCPSNNEHQARLHQTEFIGVSSNSYTI